MPHMPHLPHVLLICAGCICDTLLLKVTFHSLQNVSHLRRSVASRRLVLSVEPEQSYCTARGRGGAAENRAAAAASSGGGFELRERGFHL